MSFWSNYHSHLLIQFKQPKTPSHIRTNIPADAIAAGQQEARWFLKKHLLETEMQQLMYTGRKELTLRVVDKVWLSTWHFKITRLSYKLDFKCTELHTVSMAISKRNYKLHLWKKMRNHNMFHIFNPN